MIYKIEPKHRMLFEWGSEIFSKSALKRIREGWQGVMRYVVLELMPVDVLAGHFDPVMGRPTKELYSMAGLMLLMEFHNWTPEQAAEAYMFRNDVAFALNVPMYGRELSSRTVERYQRIFREEDLAARVMQEVTVRFCDILEQVVANQRLDSTHVFSDMAVFGRTRMMGVTVKRFLEQVFRHDREAYDALPEALRTRYTASEHRIFADCSRDEEGRKRLRLEVAQDMYFLMGRFEGDPCHGNRKTFLALVQVFEEQCEVEEERVEVKAKPGGDVIQNPSDLDGTRDGHKGPGYQAQLSETCSPENEVQLITAALPQTAAETDQDALPLMLDQLEASGLMPKTLATDTHYGSDENVCMAAQKGVEVISPVSGQAPKADTMTIGDFTVNPETETVEQCPAGHAPVRSEHDPETGKTRTYMHPEVCAQCPQRGRCPMQEHRGQSWMDHSAKERRLDARRREQATPQFKARYGIRNGIESTNSGVKRRTGLDRLRVRGKKSVYHSILLKLCGWNILRAASAQKMKAFVAEKMGMAEKSALILRILYTVHRLCWPLRACVSPQLARWRPLCAQASWAQAA